MSEQRATQVLGYLHTLQDNLCRTFGDEMGGSFLRDAWQRPAGEGKLQGGGITACQEGGATMERAGVALSDVRGSQLPPSATARNPHLAGREFRAMGVSVVMHPRNPHAPTSHMNVRFFSAGDVWWFGGGFDLTPYVPYEEDIVAWHRAARDACAAVSTAAYPIARQHCDEYFFLKHRGEARGVGGIFYDDVNEQSPGMPLSWEQGFALMQRVGNAFHDAYKAVMDRRRDTPFTDRERRYQLYRRGRYVEFNLVFDRGTLFGLQSGGRTEAILVSMPPEAHWSYRSPDPEMDSKLLPYLTTLRGRDWLT
ncbi:MAG: oxygen-dependent coproporphyrinogen oxidase [Proteobacteria bacterium]|jgi:coproporphyrinogen III oxidase|nr:oxygen-dependent coproporphyrinogen oxidase [Pseudomonadota bacterium]